MSPSSQEFFSWYVTGRPNTKVKMDDHWVDQNPFDFRSLLECKEAIYHLPVLVKPLNTFGIVKKVNGESSKKITVKLDDGEEIEVMYSNVELPNIWHWFKRRYDQQ